MLKHLASGETDGQMPKESAVTKLAVKGPCRSHEDDSDYGCIGKHEDLFGQ